MPNPQALLEKIQALPPERIAEVEDFVEFITSRENDRALIRAAGAMSAPAFAKIWENAEDDAYDAI
jgi:ABC-type glycerol-3-phosphate transport system substrate-binding protein